MIIVIGSLIVQAGQLEQALGLSLAHVRRSRAEPGCIAHAVHQDAEQPQRLVFVEQWQDRAALMAHFKLPQSRAFVGALSALATQAPSMGLYEATPMA